MVRPQQDFVLCGRLLSSSLLLGQEFLESGRGEGQSLSPETHQVRVLQPRVVKAVFDRRTSPGARDGHRDQSSFTH